MAYTVRHQKKDGSVTVIRHDRESVLEKFPCNPMSGSTAAQARNNIEHTLKETRRNLRDPKGFNKGKTARLVAQIPMEVIAHVRRNEGREAANDTRYCLRAAEKLGIDCRVSKGKF